MRKLSEYQLLIRFLNYYREKQYAGFIIVSVVLMLFVTVILVLVPYLPKYVIDNILAAKDYEKLYYLAGIAIIGVIAHDVSKYCYSVLLMSVHERASLTIRHKLVQSIYCRNFPFFDNKDTGYLYARIMADVQNLSPVSLENILNIIFTIIFIIVTLIFLFSIDPILTLLAIVYILIGVSITEIPKKKIQNKAISNSENWANVNAKLQEQLSGIRIIKLFNQEKFESDKIYSLFSKAVDYQITFKKYVQIFCHGMITIATLSLVSTLLFALLRVMTGVMTLGTCISFFMYAQWVFNLTAYLNSQFTMIRTAIGPLQRIFELLDQVEFNESHIELVQSHSIQFKLLKFEGISFEYEKNQRILKNISFEVKQGERIVIVGENGCGKSTIGKLLLKMYSPNNGQILINHQDINNCALNVKDIRDKVGFVMQDNFLFGDTILNNLLYGNRNAILQDVYDVAKLVDMHEFISGLPDQYDTKLTELAQNLSGGQKQRLCIARALLHQYDIYFFDEITSNLDKKTEKNIINTIFKKYTDEIFIFASHSLHILDNAGRIIFMENGEITCVGKHDNIYESSERYRTFYNKIKKNEKAYIAF